MQFRKNSFSYILWAFYSIAVLNALCCFAVLTAKQLGYGPVYGWLSAALILFVCVDVVLVLCSLRRSELPFRTPGWLENIGTAVATTAFFAFLVFEKIISFPTGYGDDSMYFKWARVGGKVPRFAEGARDWYVQLLHRVFLLFGNRSVVIYGFQVTLELLALVFLFFAIRRLWGNLAALFLMLGWSLLSLGTDAFLQPGPSLLYLCFFALALFLISFVSPAREYSWIMGIFAGVFTGLVIYLNSLGLILFLPAFAVFWAREEYENLQPPHPVPFGRRFGSFASITLAAVMAFLGIQFADSLLSGESFGRVLEAYGSRSFAFGSPAFPDLTGLFPGASAVSVLILLTLGIPVWFRRMETDIQSIPAWMAVTILALKCFHFSGMEEVADPILFSLILCLCGCACSGLVNLKSFRKTEEEVSGKKTPDQTEKKQDTGLETVALETPAQPPVEAPEEATAEVSEEKPVKASEESQVEKPVESPAEAAEEKPAEASEETPAEPAPNTEFLAVPLPRKAPRPHKEMDYDIEVSDDDDYDI